MIQFGMVILWGIDLCKIRYTGTAMSWNLVTQEAVRARVHHSKTQTENGSILAKRVSHGATVHDSLVYDRDEPGVLVIAVSHDTSVSPCPGADKAHLDNSALESSGYTTAEIHAYDWRRANR